MVDTDYSLCSHNIYKWQADKRRQAARPRSASFAGSTHTQPPHPAFEHIHEPGGFRRTYVMLNDPERATQRPMVRNFIEFLYIFGHFVSTFPVCLEFVAYATTQAGEDLEEIEEEDEDELLDDERLPGTETPFLQGGSYGTNTLTVPSTGIPSSVNGHKTSETSPLLERPHISRSRSRRRAASVGPHGDATVTDAVLMVRPLAIEISQPVTQSPF